MTNTVSVFEVQLWLLISKDKLGTYNDDYSNEILVFLWVFHDNSQIHYEIM